MADERFLLVKLGSLGDIMHTLPAVAALRDSFPGARIDWLVERKWAALLEGNPDLSDVVALDRGSWNALGSCVGRLRATHYTCAVDFQGLYKSAILTFLSGASRRVGLAWHLAREGGAALFYDQRVTHAARHRVELNLALAERAGARITIGHRFGLRIPAEAEAAVATWLAASALREFFVISPGGGWRSKCWPPERFGELCRELARRGWRGIVNYGPGESELAEAVCRAAAPAEPLLFSSDLAQLMAMLRRARIVVAGDTGPLHLAVALGTPVVGLYGPTDPRQTGPYCATDIVVRNAPPEETTYKRGNHYTAAMLSITVEQVLAAVDNRLGKA